jgi:hypothetical protein
MPKGEFNPSRNTERVSATPSPSASRSRVMRLALGTAAPAFFMMAFIARPLRPFMSSGRGGAFVSATSTSPLGSTYTQRGCSRPRAKAVTRVPGPALGCAPAGQPLAGAMSTVGIREGLGGGSCGSGPIPAESGRRAMSAQAVRPRSKASE